MVPWSIAKELQSGSDDSIVNIWSEIGESAIVAEGIVTKMKQMIPSKGIAAFINLAINCSNIDLNVL